MDEIGRCSVCQRMARLDRGGCRECFERYGVRFVEVAARVRREPKLAGMVLEAIRDPAHRELFVRYFGADGDCAPPRSRTRRL